MTSHGFHGLDGFLSQRSIGDLKNSLRFAFRPLYDFTLGFKEVRSADALVAISNHDVEIYSWMGVSREKIHQIPLGVRDLFFGKGDSVFQDSLRQRLGCGPVILSVGELSSVKGKDIPLRALAGLLDDYPDAKLVYVGKEVDFIRS